MRLNATIREEILSSLLKHRFDKEESSQQKQWSELAEMIYDANYNATTRATMGRLPQGFLPTRDAFSVKADGQRKCMRLSGEMLFTYVDYHGQPWKLTGPLLKCWRVLERQQEATRKAKAETRRQARAMLLSVTTMKKLRQVWPEVIPFIPKESTLQLPAVMTKDLNTLLGLS